MFARVSVYEIPEGREDEASRSFRDALGQIAECRGFADAVFLVSGESGKGIAVTFWDDRDCMSASRVTATRLRGDAIDAVEGEVVSADEFEVALRISPPDGD